MIDMNGKVVLVTGAAGGIGAATVAKIGALGGATVAHDLREPGGGDLRLSGDLRDPEAARALWSEAWVWRDGIDVLVNCAGIYRAAAIEAPFADWVESWRQTLDINLLAPAVLCREAIVAMRARCGGIIVNIASRAAWRGDDAEYQHYAASKAAVVAMTKTIARQYGRDGVTAYAVAPWFVNTPFNDALVAEYGLEFFADDTGLGEVAGPQDLANVIVFLASGLARHATGATIDVNGASYVR